MYVYSDPNLLYLDLLDETLNHGFKTPDRTGVGCTKTLNAQLVYNKDEFPFSLSRPLGIKYAWEEMKLFLSGITCTKSLEDQGIMFWKGNTSREFLDSRNMSDYPEGSLGKSYSYQFRHPENDQVKNLISTLQKDPFSRRMSIDLWNILEQSEMPLLPCWFRSAWSVQPSENPNSAGILHLKLYSRSNDLLFGYHQAAIQYRLFQIALSKMLNFELGMLVTDLWDVHIYSNQVDYVSELLQREPGKSGTVRLGKNVSSLEDILALDHSDFIIEGYEPNRSPMKTPRPEMAV